MAKKKKHKKSVYKQHKKQAAAQTTVVTPEANLALASNEQQPVQSTKTSSKEPDISVVTGERAKREVKHSLILAGMLLVGLALLWLLFAKTALGGQVYQLIKL